MSEESLPDALPDYAERVLDVADRIPPGRVMTYGDVAEWLEEGGPRQVGRVMALYGGAVPWWRVIRADGVLLPGHELEALGHYREEGTYTVHVRWFDDHGQGNSADFTVTVTEGRPDGRDSDALDDLFRHWDADWLHDRR